MSNEELYIPGLMKRNEVTGVEYYILGLVKMDEVSDE
jgi:hypothetical protein